MHGGDPLSSCIDACQCCYFLLFAGCVDGTYRLGSTWSHNFSNGMLVETHFCLHSKRTLLCFEGCFQCVDSVNQPSNTAAEQPFALWLVCNDSDFLIAISGWCLKKAFCHAYSRECCHIMGSVIHPFLTSSSQLFR